MKIGKFLSAMLIVGAIGSGCNSTTPKAPEPKREVKRAEFIESYRKMPFEEQRKAVEGLFTGSSWPEYVKGIRFIRRPTSAEEVSLYEGLPNKAFPERIITGNELMLTAPLGMTESEAILKKGAGCMIYVFDDIFTKDSPVKTKNDIKAMVEDHELVHCTQQNSGFELPIFRNVELVYLSNSQPVIDGDLYIGLSESEAYANFIGRASQSTISFSLLNRNLVEYAYVHYPRAITKLRERVGKAKAREFAQGFFPSYLLRTKGVVSQTGGVVSYQFFPGVPHGALPFGEVFYLPSGLNIGQLEGKIDTKDMLTITVH